jgi:hypothetical protein
MVDDTTVDLASTSETGRFDIDASGLFDGTVTSVVIPAGSSTGDFYYKDTAVGNPTITVSSEGFKSSSQEETVLPGDIDHYSVSNISSPQVIEIPFSVTIQAQDEYNNNLYTGSEVVDISFTWEDAGASPMSVTTDGGVGNISDMTLTVAQTGQALIFAGETSGKSGISNYFDVADKYILTIDIEGNGNVIRMPDQADYLPGESVQLTAVPAEGWSFVEWSGDASGSTNPTDVIMDGNKSFTAVFAMAGTFGLDSGNNTSNTAGNVLNAMRFRNNSVTGTLTALELLVDDSTPSGSVMMGVYADNNGRPGVLLLNAGEINLTNGWVSITGLNLPVTRDSYYWLAFNLQSPNRIRYLSGQASNSHYYVSSSYGSLPGIFPVSRVRTNNSQFVMRAFVLNGTQNNPPIAEEDYYSVNSNGVLDVGVPGVLDNDTDTEGDALTAILVSTAASGDLIFNSDGSFVYTPQYGYIGDDSFTYMANDGVLDSNVAVVHITVSPAPTIDTFGLDSGTGTSNQRANLLQAMRFRNTAGTGTLTMLELLVNDSSPNGRVRLGVYADNNGRPGSCLLDAGEVNVANGWIAIDGLNLAVNEGTDYWLVFVLNTSNKIRYQSGQPSGSHVWGL